MPRSFTIMPHCITKPDRVWRFEMYDTMAASFSLAPGVTSPSCVVQSLFVCLRSSLLPRCAFIYDSNEWMRELILTNQRVALCLDPTWKPKVTAKAWDDWKDEIWLELKWRQCHTTWPGFIQHCCLIYTPQAVLPRMISSVKDVGNISSVGPTYSATFVHTKQWCHHIFGFDNIPWYSQKFIN